MPDAAPAETLPFWKRKRLTEMSAREWESLCDGCGKCCLHKLQDDETGKVYYTNVACRLLDCGTCRCTDYDNRKRKVPNCVQLTPDNIDELFWMPQTCAYRLLAEGRDLPDWHPLVTGDPNSTLKAGHSVAGRVIPEGRAYPDLTRHLVDWE